MCKGCGCMRGKKTAVNPDREHGQDDTARRGPHDHDQKHPHDKYAPTPGEPQK